jgi:hypothetical protein
MAPYPKGATSAHANGACAGLYRACGAGRVCARYGHLSNQSVAKYSASYSTAAVGAHNPHQRISALPSRAERGRPTDRRTVVVREWRGIPMSHAFRWGRACSVGTALRTRDAFGTALWAHRRAQHVDGCGYARAPLAQRARRNVGPIHRACDESNRATDDQVRNRQHAQQMSSALHV